MIDKLPLPARLEDEILQLVDWELDRMWDDRDFLSVIIPRALLDPEVGQVLSKIGPPRLAKAIAERLKHFAQCRTLPDEEREAVALFAGVIGFVFGFMRPVVLGQTRNEAKKTAITLATIFVRSFHAQALDGTSQPGQELPHAGGSIDRAKSQPSSKARATDLRQGVVIEGK